MPFLKGAESVLLDPPSPHYPTCAHTYYFLPTSFTFPTGPGAYLAKKSTDNGKKNGRTRYEFPSTQPPLKDSPPLFCAWPNRQDIQSSIPTTFWAFLEQTPGPTEPGLAICFAFLLLLVFGNVVGNDGNTTEKGRRTGLLFLFLFVLQSLESESVAAFKVLPFLTRVLTNLLLTFIVCLYNNCWSFEDFQCGKMRKRWEVRKRTPPAICG
jgi:hypothetical protein